MDYVYIMMKISLGINSGHTARLMVYVDHDDFYRHFLNTLNTSFTSSSTTVLRKSHWTIKGNRKADRSFFLSCYSLPGETKPYRTKYWKYSLILTVRSAFSLSVFYRLQWPGFDCHPGISTSSQTIYLYLTWSLNTYSWTLTILLDDLHVRKLRLIYNLIVPFVICGMLLTLRRFPCAVFDVGHSQSES